jgi:methionine synthase II (cobalamin-independent)
VIQFDEPAFNVYMAEVKDWGIEALHRAIEGVGCTTAVHICGMAPMRWDTAYGKLAALAQGAALARKRFG